MHTIRCAACLLFCFALLSCTSSPENIAELAQVGELDNNNFRVLDIAFSPDGKFLASGYSRNRDVEQPVDIILWNIETKKESSRLSGHSGRVTAVVFNPNGSQLASGGIDGIVNLWDLSTGDSKIILDGYPMPENTSMEMYGTKLEKLPISSLAFIPDGSILAVAGGAYFGGAGWLELYDTSTGKKITMLVDNRELTSMNLRDISDITFSPDGKFLAAAGIDGIWIWDMVNRHIFRKIEDTQFPYPVAFTSDGKLLAGSELWYVSPSDSEDNQYGGIHLWDVKTGEMLDLFDVRNNTARSIALSPDGKFLAVGLDQSVALWDMTTDKLLDQIDCTNIPAINFSPDGSLLAVADSSGVIRLWGVTIH